MVSLQTMHLCFFHCVILRSVSKACSVVCCKLALDCPCNVYYLVTCTHAVLLGLHIVFLSVEFVQLVSFTCLFVLTVH